MERPVYVLGSIRVENLDNKQEDWSKEWERLWSCLVKAGKGLETMEFIDGPITPEIQKKAIETMIFVLKVTMADIWPGKEKLEMGGRWAVDAQPTFQSLVRMVMDLPEFPYRSMYLATKFMRDDEEVVKIKILKFSLQEMDGQFRLVVSRSEGMMGKLYLHHLAKLTMGEVDATGSRLIFKLN